MNVLTNTRLVNKTLVPPWSFDVDTGEYRSNYDGHTLTAQELRKAVEAVILGVKTDAADVVARFRKSKRTREDLQEMSLVLLALLTGLHTAVSAAATGGVPGVLEDAEADLRATMARERAYMTGWMRQLAIGLGLTSLPRLGVQQAYEVADERDGTWEVRAMSYADSALMTFERHRYMLYRFLDYTEAQRVMHQEAEHCLGCERQAGKGWRPIGELVPLGHEECGQWCQCDVEYRKTTPRLQPTGGI